MLRIQRDLGVGSVVTYGSANGANLVAGFCNNSSSHGLHEIIEGNAIQYKKANLDVHKDAFKYVKNLSVLGIWQ